MPANRDETRTQHPDPAAFDPGLDAGLAAAFGPDLTPGGWSQPPLLRDDPSEHSPLVQPGSPEVPRGAANRYQLLGEIARGGMGVVIKGRDPDLGRDLAFKVLRSELANKPAAVQRFTEEAQVGGQLQHPGVVPVYDLGRFPDGRPYFAMKLVKGRTLADYLAERKSPSEDRGRFLQSFLQVCQPIAYAHSKGVIHRDIKPSNVMVGAFGEVLVVDWGLAKVLPRGGIADELKAQSRVPSAPAPEEPTEIKTARAGSGAGSETQAGSVMGTPAFMSPEQAGGEIDKLDERADVFGLGAVLCVVLTGRPPYVADTAEAVRLMAVRGDLEECFARLNASGTDAELVGLCKRCLAPKREVRPRHAGEVEAAVAGYLAEVEGRAQRAEVARAAADAEAKEQRKRRRVQLALAASVGLLLLAGGAFGWWADRQAADRRRDREVAAVRNSEALTVALDQAEAALRADKMPDADAALTQAGRRLDDATPADLRGRYDELRGDRQMAAELDRVRDIRWSAQGRDNVIGRGKARAAYPEAFQAYGLVVGPEPSPGQAERITLSPIRPRLIAALDEWLGIEPTRPGLVALLVAADPDEFRSAFRRATAAQDVNRLAELCRQAEGGKLPPWFAVVIGANRQPGVEERLRVLRGAWDAAPNDFPVAFQTAWLLSGSTPPRTDEALAYYRVAIALNPRHAAAHNNLGKLLGVKGDKDGELAAYRKAVELAPTDTFAHCNLGVALGNRKEYDAAEAAFRTAIRLDPTYALAHRNLAKVLNAKRSDPAAVIAVARKAVELDPEDPDGHYTLGAALFEAGDWDGAATAFKRAIEFGLTFKGVHKELGRCLKRKGDWAGAAAAYRKSIELGVADAAVYAFLGEALINLKDPHGAADAYHTALRIDPNYLYAINGLGVLAENRGDLNEAVTHFRKSLELNPQDSDCSYNLGLVLFKQEKWAEAATAFRRASELAPKKTPAHLNLGLTLAKLKDWDGAVAAWDRAAELDNKLRNRATGYLESLWAAKDWDGAVGLVEVQLKKDPNNPGHHCNLGMTRKGQKDWAAAEAAYRRALELKPDLAFAAGPLVDCLDQSGRPAEAVRVATEVMRANPAWGDDPPGDVRYFAARAAARCAAGKGTDAPPPAERAAYRKLALDHLTASVAGSYKPRPKDPTRTRDQTHSRMAFLLRSTDYPHVRDPAELAKLPADERAAWEKLWADVRALRDATALPVAPPPRSATALPVAPAPREKR